MTIPFPAGVKPTEENLKRHAMLMKMAEGIVSQKDIDDCIELADNEIKEWKIFKEHCESLLNIKCANCEKETGFCSNDFNKDKDLDDVYCCEECRYNAETGHPGEEY